MSPLRSSRSQGRARSGAYRIVQQEILSRIRAKVWPPGTLIPGELDLAAEFGCARGTISRAMRELADAGVLERKRRAGTRVADNPMRRAMLEIPLVRQQVTRADRAYGYELLGQRQEVAPADVRDRLGGGADTMMVRVRALHRADGRPFQLEDRWINPATVPEVTTMDFATISANEWLVREVPLSSVETVVSAVSASDADARLLDCPPGAAILALERTTWLGDQPVTTVTLLHPPGHRVTGRV